MAFDPLQPYGPLIDTRLRMATWNVWERSGPWRERQREIEHVLAAAAPDVIALQESWIDGAGGQAHRIGEATGHRHAVSAPDTPADAWNGNVVLSRWPITETFQRPLPGRDGMPGLAFGARIDGPRGPVTVYSVITGSFRPDQSGDRQDQVRALAAFVAETAPRYGPALVCGDFNAPPDSDEIRMLTGRAAAPPPGLAFYDAWEMAGDGPGHTWSARNPWAAAALLPDRRIDYVLSAWPRRGGAGHPLRCALLGADADPAPSDHYGVLAELRY